MFSSGGKADPSTTVIIDGQKYDTKAIIIEEFSRNHPVICSKLLDLLCPKDDVKGDQGLWEETSILAVESVFEQRIKDSVKYRVNLIDLVTASDATKSHISSNDSTVAFLQWPPCAVGSTDVNDGSKNRAVNTLT